jgi:hypothetical protein
LREEPLNVLTIGNGWQGVLRFWFNERSRFDSTVAVVAGGRRSMRPRRKDLPSGRPASGVLFDPLQQLRVLDEVAYAQVLIDHPGAGVGAQSLDPGPNSDYPTGSAAKTATLSSSARRRRAGDAARHTPHPDLAQQPKECARDRPHTAPCGWHINLAADEPTEQLDTSPRWKGGTANTTAG